MKKLLHGLVIIIILLVISCDIFPPQSSETNYFPLQVGNEWHYYSPGANTFFSDSTISRIDSTYILNDKTYYVMNTYEPISNEHRAQQIYRVENGIVYWLIDNVEYVYLDFNLNVNNTWQQIPYMIYCTILSKNDTIETNLGKINNCLKYSLDCDIYTMTQLYAPDIGRVISTTVDRNIISSGGYTTYLIWAKIYNEKIVIEYVKNLNI